MNEKIFIASDHAGFGLKEKIKKHLEKAGLNFEDLGPYTHKNDDDYNDYAIKLVDKLKGSKNNKGILVCGTGQGMSIQANRFAGIRCALCWNKQVARKAREHLDANVISLPGKYIGINTAKDIINSWLNAKPLQKEKYKRRIRKLG